MVHDFGNTHFLLKQQFKAERWKWQWASQGGTRIISHDGGSCFEVL